MEIGIVNQVTKERAGKRYVISISELNHRWLAEEAKRRNTTYQQVADECFFAYRHLVSESVAIEGES